jgi:outer membrane biosynthesis protein TonB
MPAMGGAAVPGAAAAAGMASTAAMPAMGSAPATAAMPMTAGLSAYGQEAAPDAPLPRKKPNIGIFAAIGLLIVAAGVSAFILMQADDERESSDSEQLSALKSQLEELKTAKEKLAEAEQEAVKVAAETTQVKAEAEAAAAAASAETEKPAEEEAPKEMAMGEAAEEQPQPATKKGSKRGAAKRVAARAPKKAPQPKVKKSSKKEKEEEEQPKSELGSLLDGDVASGKKSPTGELPKTPSRADVKNAMRPVASRAAKCGKYSKGTVKLQITVASNGRVTQSNPVGGTANSTAGNCVAMIARTAKFAKFTNPTFTFNYPVTLK